MLLVNDFNLFMCTSALFAFAFWIPGYMKTLTSWRRNVLSGWANIGPWTRIANVSQFVWPLTVVQNYHRWPINHTVLHDNSMWSLKCRRSKDHFLTAKIKRQNDQQFSLLNRRMFTVSRMVTRSKKSAYFSHRCILLEYMKIIRHIQICKTSKDAGLVLHQKWPARSSQFHSLLFDGERNQVSGKQNTSPINWRYPSGNPVQMTLRPFSDCPLSIAILNVLTAFRWIRRSYLAEYNAISFANRTMLIMMAI